MEFTIITRGTGMRYVGDHIEPFAAMDCVLLGSHLPHCWMERGAYDGYVMQFRIPPEHPFRRADGAAALRELFAAAEHGQRFDAATARAALALLRRITVASTLARAGLLLELFALLHSALKKRRAVPLSRARVGVGAEAASRPRLEAAVQWVLDNFTQPFTLDEAVRRSAMSRATFCRQFRRYTGKTFIAFVTDARLAHAHQLLTQTSQSISEIAYASGFGSLSRFNTAFRSKFHHAPRDLRK
jgi:AraC-like DNA-binding protein